MSEGATLSVPQAIQEDFEAQKLDPECCIFTDGSQKKEDDCPICFRDIQDTDLLIKEVGCKHTFCADCFLQSTRIKKECPMCRRSIAIRPFPQSLYRIRTRMDDIEDQLSHSWRQVDDYWGEDGVTVIDYEAAVVGLETSMELHSLIAPSFAHGGPLDRMPQTDIHGIESLLVRTSATTQEIIGRLADSLVPRADRLRFAIFRFRIVIMYLESLIEAYPRLNIAEA